MSSKNKPETETALATVEETGGALVSNAMNMADLLADAGEGSKDVGLKDIALPLYKMLNASSKEVIEGEPKFIDGARAGMILNNVTQKLTKGKDGIKVLRAAYEREFVEWSPVRGSGPKGRHTPESAVVKSARSKKVPDGQGGFKDVLELPNGNYLVETAYHYVVVLKDDGGVEWASIAMSGFQLKYSARWNNMIQSHTIPNGKGGTFTPAHYQQIYLLATMPDKNAKGNFFSWNVTKFGDVQEMRQYNSAKKYREAVTSGLLKSAVGGDEPAAPGGGGTLTDDNEPPF